MAIISQLLSRKFVQDTLVLQIGKISLVLLSLVSSVITWRLMGPERLGVFALAGSFLVIWQTLDFSGIGTSTSVRLAIAIGARDQDAILDLLAFYVKVSFAINLALALLIVALGVPVAALFYQGNTRIVALGFWLSVAAIADGLYGLIPIALQSRRSMRALALLQNANQVVLTVCTIVAVLISPTPESLIVGRLVYSYSTLVMAYIIYVRQRSNGTVSYPPLGAVVARARSVSARPYWRFGVANAIDKNVAQLFMQLPIQLVGVFAGARAVGFLNIALSGITQASVFTSAVLDNMQAVVPQAVGRRDYAGLWRNFMRVLLVMGLVSLVLYGALALFAPLLIPPILGARWIPAIPPLALLALYGAINAVGGLFGPLYRAFYLMREIIAIKLITLALALALGALLLAPVGAAWMEHFLGAGRLAFYVGGSSGALIGAGIITAAFTLSVTLTAAVTLPELRKRAR